jgi:hypothetical protein
MYNPFSGLPRSLTPWLLELALTYLLALGTLNEAKGI